MKKKIWIGISVVTLLAGLSVQAASDIKVLSTTKMSDVEYNGKVYQYVLEEEIETKNPDTEVNFEDQNPVGWTLKEISYGDPEVIEEKKTLTKEKKYKDLLEKDDSKIKGTITEDGITYDLKDIKWSEEPNIEKVEYTVDYGYLTEEPKVEDTYEYTYTSPVTKKENTVKLPFVELQQGNKEWVDGFSVNVTFHNIEGGTFTLGKHAFDYDKDKLSLTTDDYVELVKMLGYDTSNYRLTSATWNGAPYEGKNGKLDRKALASGQQYATSYKALYKDEVENGKLYTATVTYSAEVVDEAVEPIYHITVRGYYDKNTVWKNIISFVTKHKAPTVAIFSFLILGVMAMVIWVIGQKRRDCEDKEDKEL